MTKNFKPFNRKAVRPRRKTPIKGNLVQTPTTTTNTRTGFTVVEQTALAVAQLTRAKSHWEPNYLSNYTPVFPMDRNLLFRVLSVQSETYKTKRMENFILRTIERWADSGMPIVASMDKFFNIYVIKGDGPVYPTIVSHTDTVHDIVPNDEYIVRSNGKYMWAENPKSNNSPQGVGGDDKVGIFIALSMLRDLPNCKAVFFADEEVGCKGSNNASMKFFEDSSLVLQCDRRGNDDFVYEIMGKTLYSTDFAAVVNPILDKFDYSPSRGGMTDVWQLRVKGLDVVSANMSCGYFSPHTWWETVGLLDVQRCYDLVQMICTELGNERWEFPVPPVKTWTSSYQTVDKETGELVTKTTTYTYDADEDDYEWGALYTDNRYGWGDPDYRFVQTKKNPELRNGFTPTDYDSTSSLSNEWNAVQQSLFGVESKTRRVSDVIQMTDEVANKVVELTTGAPSCSTCGTEGFVYWEEDNSTWMCANCLQEVDDPFGSQEEQRLDA